MSDWIKKKWLKILGVVVIIIIIYSAVDGVVSKIMYKKQIREKDQNISELEQGIEESEKRENELMESSQEWYLKAMEKEVKIKKRDAEIKKINSDREELREKIKEMPAPVVVLRTIEILNCDEIQQQEQGIVFSLACAKENLTVLEDSFSLKKEVKSWKEQFNTSQGEVSDLKNSIIAKDGIIVERGGQLGKKDGVILEWEGKFDLSEKRGKRSWWRGLKTGGTIAGIAGFVLGFFIGK